MGTWASMNGVRELLRSLRLRVLGAPLIYERFRPWVLGYHDESALFTYLDCGETDIVLDVGCGSGAAFKYLKSFEAYHGFDVDATVVERLRARHSAENVHSYLGAVQSADLERIRPSKVILIGILHHLTEGEVLALLGLIRECESVEKIITLDPIYVPRRPLNNLLCRFDAGHYVRVEEGLVVLVERSGLVIEASWHTQSGNGVAHYAQLCLGR